ncbi:hypothetical protein [Rufibacter psychrotolerans]|uniref:hypothetical protein n=1 Tax=Rufibacter psychrotolerans TaxID=2812556 RepID=UPI0019689E56|nr:hypothetical protein [Rufibacter sp. SYSU D00308]
MDLLDKGFQEAILSKLEERLQRNLSRSEQITFSKKRTLMAYEMILDHISDDTLSKEDIEKYVQAVIDEFQNDHF